MAKELLKGEGKKRTDLHCSNCSKGFVAELDYSIDGNHVVECPHCYHEHCRVIKKGEITSDRWDSRNQRKIEVSKVNVWKSSVIQAQTSTAAAFIRNKWLEKVTREQTDDPVDSSNYLG